LADLPAEVAASLNDFLAAAADALGDQLVSAVLYGSAAEGRLRATSDVNLILVLRRFDPGGATALQGAMRVARAAIQLDVMFICADEIPAAAEAFAVKFEDILHRHRVLWGENPLEALKVSRAAQVRRLRQVLLNLVLRLRNAYVLVGTRAEQAERAAVDAIGPLRAAAAALENLAGRPHASPKAALTAVVAAHGDAPQQQLLEQLSQLREGAHVGASEAVLAGVIQLTHTLHKLALATSET
jgi:hypothetical protein